MMLLPAGSRATTTFRKLPTHSPKTTTKIIATGNGGVIGGYAVQSR
jgi:hypothetical protein